MFFRSGDHHDDIFISNLTKISNFLPNWATYILSFFERLRRANELKLELYASQVLLSKASDQIFDICSQLWARFVWIWTKILHLWNCDASVLALILEHCASHELEKDKTALKNANAKTIKGKRRIRQLSCLAVNAWSNWAVNLKWGPNSTTVFLKVTRVLRSHCTEQYICG